MRTLLTAVSAVAAVVVAAAALAAAPQQAPAKKMDPPPAAPPKSPAAAAFERMKSLAGTWEGTINGDAAKTTKVTYRVIANGSAVVETLFSGGPEEMETIFHLDGQRLLCTHYCAGGNQPRLNATTIAPEAISFEMLDATNLPDRNAPHMGALKIDFVGKDHIRTNWSSIANGKVGETVVFDLQRAKA